MGTETRNNEHRTNAIVAMSVKIARLREELKQAEDALVTFIGYPTREHVLTRGNPNSNAQKIRDYVLANAGRPIPVDDIIKHHRGMDAASVRSTVHRLANGGLPGFRLAGRGMYRFDQEVPFADPRVGVQHGREASS